MAETNNNNPLDEQPEYQFEEETAALRQLEVEAYQAVISTMFAQGELTWRKEQILQELRWSFHIPNDLHKREILRVHSDQSLLGIRKKRYQDLFGASDQSDILEPAKKKRKLKAYPCSVKESGVPLEMKAANTLSLNKKKSKSKSSSSSSSSSSNNKSPKKAVTNQDNKEKTVKQNPEKEDAVMTETNNSSTENPPSEAEDSESESLEKLEAEIQALMDQKQKIQSELNNL